MNEAVRIEPRAEVLAAISKAMASVKKVVKDGKNAHDGYKFASIDDFLEMVNPICSDAGLIFHMEESGTEDFMRKGKYGESAWMRQKFLITVFHVSGQSLPPVSRSVEVLRNGAQAYGSSQSYALKQYLRSLLLIPTGDKDDADFNATDSGEIVRTPKADPKAEYEAAVSQAIRGIEGEKDIESLGEFWADLSRKNRRVAEDRRVIDAKDKRKIALNPKDATDIGGDEIPY